MGVFKSAIIDFRSERRDTCWLVLLQGLNYLVPLFVWPYLMKTLGAEGFGRIGFSLSLCQALMLLVDFGFNWTASKAIALHQHNRAKVNEVFRQTMTAKLCLLIVSAVVLSLLMAIPRFAPYRRVCGCMWVMVLGNTFSMQWLYQGLGKIRLVSMINCACRLLILPLTFLLVHNAADVMFAAAIQSSTYVLSGLIIVVMTMHLRLVDDWHWDWSGAQSAIRDSAPVFVSTALSSVYALLYVVILGYFSTEAEVGHYSAVEKVMRVGCYMFLLPVLQAFFPKVSQLAQTDRAQARGLMKHLIWLMSGVMVVLGVVLYSLAPTILTYLGRDYSGTESIFRIMAFIPLLIAWSGIVGQLGLLAQGGDREKKMFRNVYLVTAMVSVVIILLMSVHLTAQLAAIALLVTEAVAAVGMGVESVKCRV